MTIRNVALLGLGIMGGGMARQLLEAGFHVTVWNRSKDKAASPAAAGPEVAQKPARAGGPAGVRLRVVSCAAAFPCSCPVRWELCALMQ